MNHITSTKIVTRNGRQYRKVTCSCEHFIITTDSQQTAYNMAMAHLSTPECPHCHHRNTHDQLLGCTFQSDPALLTPDECLCVGQPAQPYNLAGTQTGRMSVVPCSECGHHEAHNQGKGGTVCSYSGEPQGDGLLRERVACYCGVPGIRIVDGKAVVVKP